MTGGWRGPGWRVVDADPECGRQVRGWLASAIARHGGAADPAEATLAIGELFANAVMHGPAGGRVLVGYCLWPEGARIVVCDGGGSTTPRLRDGPGWDEGGRGLRMVDAVTASWGCFRCHGNQVVWCDVGQPLRVPACDVWAWLDLVLATSALSGVSTRPSPVREPLLAAGADRDFRLTAETELDAGLSRVASQGWL